MVCQAQRLALTQRLNPAGGQHPPPCAERFGVVVFHSRGLDSVVQKVLGVARQPLLPAVPVLFSPGDLDVEHVDTRPAALLDQPGQPVVIGVVVRHDHPLDALPVQAQRVQPVFYGRSRLRGIDRRIDQGHG